MPVTLDDTATIARDAGERILEVARRGVSAREKSDRSPVTDADEIANHVIVERLRQLTPDVPVVAEESLDPGMKVGTRFWLVDPLDGTREFISGRDEYTVNIAFIDSGHAVLGVVLVPARAVLYAGETGQGAWREEGTGTRAPISTRAVPDSGPVAAASRSHSNPATDAWLAEEGVRDVVRAGSSLKICLVAEGTADVYPRLGRTMEWDTAAAHAVLSAAGGAISTLSGDLLTYGKPGFENPHFVVRGDPGT